MKLENLIYYIPQPKLNKWDDEEQLYYKDLKKYNILARKLKVERLKHS